MLSTIPDVLPPGFDALDPDCIVVETAQSLWRLSADILGERSRPIVGLAPDSDGDRSSLGAAEVREVVGRGVRIYLVSGDELLDELREMIGPRMALDRGAVRIWWPGATRHSRPAEHPSVAPLAGERDGDTLEELARQFDLSRPRVRRHVALIDDARALVEHDLARLQDEHRRAHERLRDAQLECHTWRTRAEVAEASLGDALRQPDLD